MWSNLYIPYRVWSTLKILPFIDSHNNYSDHLFDVMVNIIIKKYNNLNIFNKYNCCIIYYGIIKVKYLECLPTILFVCLLFFSYNDYNNTNIFL